MKRIYMNSFDDWGCGHYRAKLPVLNCYSDMREKGVNLILERELHSNECYYDAYILHRCPVENSIFFMQTIQKNGKKFVLEIDDDIFNIPEWMPSDEYKNPKWSLKRAVDMCDEIWAATPTLAATFNKPEKTYVLPNLVDCNSFLESQPHTDQIRILWMGSMWHDRDIDQLTNPVIRIIKEFGDKVQFLFWGCLPTAFADYNRIPGQNMAVLTQKKDFGASLIYLEGLPFKFYYDRLIKLGPCIGLAPLYDCTFNDSKSNLKYLEYTMAGAATIACDLLPYKCIENEVDGLLVEPHDENGWYEAIKRMIEDNDLRNKLVSNAQSKVRELYSWHSKEKRDLWVNAFERLVK